MLRSPAFVEYKMTAHQCADVFRALDTDQDPERCRYDK